MPAGVLIAYFTERNEARQAVWELYRHGFLRAALAHKTASGAVRTWDLFAWLRLVGISLAALLGLGLGSLANSALLQAALMLAGGLAAGVWLQRSKLGVERRLLEQHGRWLTPEESVIILHAPVASLRAVVTQLRAGRDIQPAIFVLHPRRGQPTRAAAAHDPGALLSTPQLQAFAARLAAEHQIDPRPKRNAELLARLRAARQSIHLACADLYEASRLEQSLPPAAEWLLDNEYVMESNARDVQQNMSRRFYQQLPVLANALANGPQPALPRIYSLAESLTAHTDCRLDRQNIQSFIEAYQTQKALTIGELWAIAQMLRIALIERIDEIGRRSLAELRQRESASLWANRLMTVHRRNPSQLFAILAELANSQPDPSPYFAAQLVDNLYDEAAVLAPVQGWLERTYNQPLTELSLREQNRQTRDQISIGNAFTSLRQLAVLDWSEIFEDLSAVHQVLGDDPAGVYSRMDFATRDRYRRAVEEIARGAKMDESRTARLAIQLAEQARDDERRSNVGAFLIGEGRPELTLASGGRERPGYLIRQWIIRRHAPVYLVSMAVLTVGAVLAVASLGLSGQPLSTRLLLAVLLLIPASQLALDALNYLASRLLPPHSLPKMDFEQSGIPDEFRTLVVVPVLLDSAATICAEVDKLEIRYLANKEDNLLFSLFTDHIDSHLEHQAGDGPLLAEATEGLNTLNGKYGAGRFFLLHRERLWSETERKFIGWERKRGKLEELNGLIAGTRPEDAPPLVAIGDPQQLADVRFVMTLDSDTQLPAGAARRLVETLAHPLNQPRFDPQGRVLAGTYTIIQPRVSPSLPSTSASPFSRLFADAVGIDPYTQAVSDLNQDLTHEGSYHGKAIYDVRAFNRVLAGRFPEALLLSHDLIEGAHVRVGLASDIELFDEFPRGYLTYASRQHRWIRGDWQIADWVLPRVPQHGGGGGPNYLSAFNRWKILDNLRRSLLPAASLALLVAAWLTSTPMGWLATLVVAAQLLFVPFVQPMTMATTRHGLRSFSLAKIVHDLARAGADAALLPHQAGLALDAILRVAYRRLVSKRGLLEWTSAQAAAGEASDKLSRFVRTMALASLFSVLVALALAVWRPASLPLASPWLLLWFLSPLVGWALNQRPRPAQPQQQLAEPDRHELRGVARQMWRYFEEFVGPRSSWLPPDNFQVWPRRQVAMRTSPTNIGLGLLSALAAHDFGYITPDQLLQRLANSLETIGKLERHEGHLLNWYDIQTLQPLEPRYVSFVDSGNLLGALWALAQGINEVMHRPLLDGRAFDGLQDAAYLLRQAAGKHPPPGLTQQDLDSLMEAWASPPGDLAGGLMLLRRTQASLSALAEPAHVRAGVTPDAAGAAAYWARQLAAQAAAWLALAARYLAWVDILSEKSEEEISALGPETALAIRHALQRAPSLTDLAGGRVDCIGLLAALGDSPDTPAAAPDRAWLGRVLEAFSQARWLAGEALALQARVVQDGSSLSEGMNLRFLYNAERRLFTIGYNVTDSRRDTSYYDLLASEARLGSFVAIARGDVPVEHWFALSRPYQAVRRRRVLLSWAGTMFEYLMPLIFQSAPSNTLLGDAAQEAVAVHIDYGRQRRVPWGISESAYADLDRNKTYQYKDFGVPSLSLKRRQSSELVVAPYASLLAISLAPREALHNLKQLAGLGLRGEYGYFESLDYSRRPSRDSAPGVVVQTYMAHHQGMALLALANFLRANTIQNYFQADARVRAVLPLLHERIPSGMPARASGQRERSMPAQRVGVVAPSESRFSTPHTPTPKTQLLGNGRYNLMVTNAGGGYSQWGDFEITRWRSDRTQDHWGTFCYIRDTDSGRIWSSTYQPTCGQPETFAVTFALDRAVFLRSDYGIQSETEIVVSPEDDVEIRRMTLTNRTAGVRHLSLTSYVELCLAPHNADRQHPAFSKMFVETEAAPDAQALLARRRPRSPDDRPIHAAHRLTLEHASGAPMQFETDRLRFIGRGRSLADPMGAAQVLGNSQGFVMDPIFSLRHTLTLAPGERVRVSMVLAAGESREAVLGLMGKYADPHTVDRALDFAWAAAQLELRMLRLQPDEARRFQQLASHLLFPNPFLRAPADRIKENTKGQAGLWPYGVSGDAPMILIRISEARDLALVRQVLQAHTYWRIHGLLADLVIFNEEAGSYEQPLRERLQGLVQQHSAHVGQDRPGGVFLRSAHQIPREDQTLFMVTANVVLVAARGMLPQQLSVPPEATQLPDPAANKRLPEEPTAPLPFMDLPYFNSLGGFTPDGREYVIYLGPNTHTPAPWVNVMANPQFGALVSETGAGFAWYGNSQRNRLTQWANDPVMDPASEAIYIRDEETGVYWTPTAAPIRKAGAYRARHGAGYTVFEHNSHGIEQELTVFVPVDDSGGAPVKLQRLKLKNASPRPRRISVTYYVAWTLGENRETSQPHVVTQWDSAARAVMAHNRYHPDYGEQISFAAIHPPADSYGGNRTSFIGRNRSLRNPAGMERKRRSMQVGTGLDPCAAQQAAFVLAPGASVEIVCMLGQGESVEAARALVAQYRDPQAVQAALTGTRDWWDRLLGRIQVRTPELAADLMINRWLLYQSLSCRMWGRSATYQSGGAFGYRDQLQDVMAFASVHPDLARQHILLAASRQFKEGDVQHWWHPPGGAGVRTRISDDLLWLPYVVAHHVRVTGDIGLLKAEVPFLDGPELSADQHEVFMAPTVADERGTLFEHCRRAVERGLTSGPNGLPLMGAGDWNDGMNLVGAGGTGESVWLGWFLAEVLHGMSDLADASGQPDLGREYRQQRQDLISRIEAAGWDGEWYLRAIFDDGTPLGSAANAEARIDSLPQSWAVLAGGDPARAAQALDSAWTHLVREADGLVLLFTPPFDKSVPSPGYIQGYPPGVRENGGQYTHAAIWFALALARRGDGERAARLMSLINPIEHARNSDALWRYGVEPYVVAADVYNLAGRVGQGGWTWYTGSAAWMQRVWVEEILGLKVRGDAMELDPVIPGHWPGFDLTYRHGDAVYEVRVDNPGGIEHGVAWVELDGQRLAGLAIPLERAAVKHRVVVQMGAAPAPAD